MAEIIVEKDRHMMFKEPFFSAQKAYIDWFLEQPWNNEENTFISLGDFFDKAYPQPPVYDLAHYWLSKAKFKRIIINVGNHDFRRDPKTKKVSLSVDPLSNDPRVEIISQPQQLNIDGVSAFVLPYLVSSTVEEKTMVDFYAKYIEDHKDHDNDYLFYHFEDEINAFHAHNAVDLSLMKGKRCGGHLHMILPGYELGMPVNHRYDERGQKNTLLSINTNTLEEKIVEVPKFLDYYSVSYPDALPEVDAVFPIWDIENCNLKEEDIKSYYGDIFIRQINKEFKKEVSESKKVKNAERLSMKEWFELFVKEKKIDSFLESKLKPIIERR